MNGFIVLQHRQRSQFCISPNVRLKIAGIVAAMLFCAVLVADSPAMGQENNGFAIPGASEQATSNLPNANDRLDGSVESPGQESTDRQIVASRRLLEVVQNGGPLMIPIGICSFMLVVFAFERFISLRRGRVIPGPFTKRFLEQVDDGTLTRDSAITVCNRDNSPMAQVFLAGVQKWGRPAVEVEQAILDAGERTSNNLRKYLRLLNGIATVTPLLGLLGTVLGMIHAFDAIASVEAGAADTKTLIATGISQALLTTAAGMSVAIPALIVYLFFSSRVDKHVMEIDMLGQKVVNLISAETLAEKSRGASTKTRKKAA